MKISIISGSHRNPSQSEKVARYIETTLANEFENIEPWVYALADNPLPLWDQTLWEDSEEWNQRLAPIKQQLIESDAFVIVSPEWHGQVPAGLKNFFLLFGKNELGHKPAMIVAVSSGDGGAYPVAELRMSSYKNSRLCYIPEQIILRNVESVLNENAAENDARSELHYRERISWALNILKAYAGALAQVRESGVTQTDKFNNGM